MKTFFRVVLGLVPQLFIIQSYATECTKLVAYGNPEYPPYLWRSGKNPDSLVGANVAYLNEIDNEIKTSIKVRYGGTWARVQEEARYGRVDLIAGAFATEERKKFLYYLEPAIANTRTLIWVDEKDPLHYTKWSDLQGLRGITVINNSFGQKFDAYAKSHLKISTVASLRQAFEMLRKGRVRFLIYEEWPARAFVQRYRITGVKSLEPAIAEEPLYLVMAKKSPCATAEMRERLVSAHQKVMKKNPMPNLLKENAELWDQNAN
ncbi:hypothetical protein AZI86_04050 [Bdellovibrio bacteriovorus]|uniref:Solute-binding protein family 3/N-terminal domain-containing protein n=1 Tax=Bdellovibrio bacteriovorus TaxID=959 RepID=A0A150WP12_BDEBC|nr:transporter substrate-binding domain-containing protein [Bdellovibrio bacteriovorus]KYG66241.1 hypothetical protein AZI86_04050 [Bdellovibrio bacteriovorus]